MSNTFIPSIAVHPFYLRFEGIALSFLTVAIGGIAIVR